MYASPITTFSYQEFSKRSLLSPVLVSSVSPGVPAALNPMRYVMDFFALLPRLSYQPLVSPFLQMLLFEKKKKKKFLAQQASFIITQHCAWTLKHIPKCTVLLSSGILAVHAYSYHSMQKGDLKGLGLTVSKLLFISAVKEYSFKERHFS